MQQISMRLFVFLGLLLGLVSIGTAQNAIITQPNPVPSLICSGDSIVFTADDNGGTIIAFQWNFNGAAAGLQTVYGQTVTFIAGAPNATPFNIELIVTDGVGVDTETFPLTVSGCNPPNIDISGSPTTICSGTQVQFLDATTPGSDPNITGRVWTFPGGAPGTSNAINPLVTYTTPGNYDVYYEISDVNGTYYDTIQNYVTVLNCPTPIADFEATPTRICPGDCINFTDNSQNMIPGQSNWSWQFAGADSSSSIVQNPVNICYQIPGLYTVVLTVSNASGSDTKVKTNYIRVDSCTPPTPSFEVEKQLICKGTCVKFTNTSSRADSVLWQFFGADTAYQFSNSDDPIVCYSQEGEYDVQLMAVNPYGAEPLQKTEYISVKDFPTIHAPEDTKVLIGQSVKLQAYGTGDGFRWSPDDGTVECIFCSRAEVSPLENTKYYVTNSNDHGCERTDSVNVVVVKNYYRGVPDAFSPNGDEENDVLRVLGNGITAIEMYIYNRQGDIIFESRDQTIGWDGTYKGQPSAPGAYVYFVKITFESGFQEILKGDVTLVR